MSPRLHSLVELTGAPLEEVALAVAAEFKPVAAERVRAQLDLLASTLDRAVVGDPEARAEALLDALGTRAGFSVADEEHPRWLMIDEVLATRSGHPLLLAIVYAAVARRAGFDLYPVGDARMVLLADPQPQPALAIDPVPGGRRPPAEMRWMCPHVVALRLLDAIHARYLNRGDLKRAIRAAELRTLLPLGADARRRNTVALRALLARLN